MQSLNSFTSFVWLKLWWYTRLKILYHIPLLCEEKNVPYTYLSTKKNLGKALNINVGSSSIAIEKFGSGNENILDDILKQIEALKK